MKIALYLLMLVCNFSARAKDVIDLKNIEKGVDEMVIALGKSGLVGQVVKISACYEELGKLDKESPRRYKKFEYCLAMDLAASKFDYDFASLGGFHRLEFLELENVAQRMKPFEADLQLPPSTAERIMSHVKKYSYTAFKKIHKY